MPNSKAQDTHQWTESRYDEFERGTPTNVAMRNDGRLEPAPALRNLAATSSTFLWSIAASSADLYAGTGAPSGGSQLLKIDASGTVTTSASFKELGVQSVLALADGSVLAATAPDGKVYRVTPGNATPQVVFDPTQTTEKPKYLWAMALAKNGDLLIAAGAPATIFRVSLKTPAAKPEAFFKSGDQHIRSLVVAPDGTVFAGSDGAGLIYRITPEGKPFALYAAPKHEITALALDATSNLYAAAVGDRKPPALPPLAANAGQPAGGGLITILQAGSALAATSNSLIPDGSQIYRIAPDGTPLRLVAFPQDVVYALSMRNDKLFAGTGNRGRVYRIDTTQANTYTDIAHTESSQVTAIAQTPSGLALATANSGKILQVSDVVAANATFVSDVFDAATTTRWGRVETEGSVSGIDLFVRSGNVENAHDSLAHLWSDWTPVKPNQTPLPIPAARYLQWKAVLHPGTQLRSLSVNYLQRNLPPQIDDIVVQPGARAVNAGSVPTGSGSISVSFQGRPSAAQAPAVPESSAGPLSATRDRNAVTARWLAHDPNNDPLTFTLEYRDVRETNWHPLKNDLHEHLWSFDSSQLPDGNYELRITATDALAHAAADALTAQRVSDAFTLDTTPPVPGPLTASIQNGKLHATFEATDATTPIARAQYALDGGEWQYLEPTGGLSDSLTEHYDLTLPVTAGEHTIAIRIADRAGNATSAKAIAK